MKRDPGCLLALLIWALTSEGGLCQSTFVFRNFANGIDAPIFDASGNRLFGMNYIAELYGGPTTDSLQPAVLESPPGGVAQASITDSYRGQAGYFDVGYLSIVGNVPPGGVAWLQVRAWDTRLGSSYEEVSGIGLGGYGESNLFQVEGGWQDGGVPKVAGQMVGLESFSLLPEVPEPSALALAALGGLTLLLGRLKRCQGGSK